MQVKARLAHGVIEMGWSIELDNEWLPNGLEMSRPASQGQYRTETDIWLAGSAPSSC
ncbi:MAG TPA: hypothetical protein VI729_01590 [Anaerolineales bacterium]|nr:hypothetical protein [Anaerolineales bacterium]